MLWHFSSDLCVCVEHIDYGNKNRNIKMPTATHTRMLGEQKSKENDFTRMVQQMASMLTKWKIKTSTITKHWIKIYDTFHCYWYKPRDRIEKYTVEHHIGSSARDLRLHSMIDSLTFGFVILDVVSFFITSDALLFSLPVCGRDFRHWQNPITIYIVIVFTQVT